jgi:hypothetical protein
MEFQRAFSKAPWESRVEVRSLIDPAMLIEVEADPVVA